MRAPALARQDPLARGLEWGVAVVIVVAPLPFGAVLPEALLLLESGALLLLGVWLWRAVRRPAALPPAGVRAGVLGLLALALVQILPLGRALVARVSPRSAELREASRAPAQWEALEQELLGIAPATFEPPATLSVDPDLTASALRTGVALAGLMLAAHTVAAVRGLRLLALAFLLSAGFQGLYGALVLASGHEMIWHLPKRYYLDSATGTFVNRNHFAAYLNAALACGLALALEEAARWRAGRTGRRPGDLPRPEGSRVLLLGLLVVLGTSGLLLSFSRAGIAFGLVALSAVLFASGGSQSRRTRMALIAALVIVAAVPLSQIGSERLAERYARTAADFASPSGRVTVWLDTLRMAGAFPVVGTGFGTFAAAYPLFRSPEVRLYYRHAHNDLLQFLAEGGVLGGALLALVLAPLVRPVRRALCGAGGVLATGAAAGLMALLGHSLVDFQFHIPSNAATGAVLGGALMGLPWSERS
jgi:O-antigen ligase